MKRPSVETKYRVRAGGFCSFFQLWVVNWYRWYRTLRSLGLGAISLIDILLRMCAGSFSVLSCRILRRWWSRSLSPWAAASTTPVSRVSHCCTDTHLNLAGSEAHNSIWACLAVGLSLLLAPLVHLRVLFLLGQTVVVGELGPEAAAVSPLAVLMRQAARTSSAARTWHPMLLHARGFRS